LKILPHVKDTFTFLADVKESFTPDPGPRLGCQLDREQRRDDLVNESGLTPDRYVEIVTTAALAALASPLSEQASPSP
jgi:hypothetical protein